MKKYYVIFSFDATIKNADVVKEYNDLHKLSAFLIEQGMLSSEFKDEKEIEPFNKQNEDGVLKISIGGCNVCQS